MRNKRTGSKYSRRKITKSSPNKTKKGKERKTKGRKTKRRSNKRMIGGAERERAAAAAAAALLNPAAGDAGGAPAPATGEEVGEWLQSLKLGQYAEAIRGKGYTNVSELKDLDEDTRNKLAKDVGMLVGHGIKFKNKLNDLNIPRISAEIVASDEEEEEGYLYMNIPDNAINPSPLNITFSQAPAHAPGIKLYIIIPDGAMPGQKLRINMNSDEIVAEYHRVVFPAADEVKEKIKNYFDDLTEKGEAHEDWEVLTTIIGDG